MKGKGHDRCSAPEDTVNSHDAGKEVQLKRQQNHREKTYTGDADVFGKEMPAGVCYYTGR